MIPAHVQKYPRTPHLPWSMSATSDDKIASPECLNFLRSGVELVVTEKMDGGNLTFYRDFFHARSLDSGTHPWDTMSRSVWSEVRFDIPQGWRVTGESLQARRSVAYDALPGPFMVFGVWNDKNELLSWDDMVEWADLLGLPVVPLLYRGSDFDAAVQAWAALRTDDISEGFVVRNAGSFSYDNFENNVAKYVRSNHVRTDSGWRHRDDFEVNSFSS